MIVGSANPETLIKDTPTVSTFSTEPLVFTDVICFQAILEMRSTARESVLPPSLHPTIPPALSIQVWDVRDGTYGPCRFAITRVSCRSGVRARGFTTGMVTNVANATTDLRDRFGFPAVTGDIDVLRGFDRFDAKVSTNGTQILSVSGVDPDPMGNNDVQYTGMLNLAHVSAGLRLLQVETQHTATQVERLSSTLHAFDPAAWGNPLLSPYRMVAATVAHENINIPPLRFMCKVDELAFTGTEAIS